MRACTQRLRTPGGSGFDTCLQRTGRRGSHLGCPPGERGTPPASCLRKRGGVIRGGLAGRGFILPPPPPTAAGPAAGRGRWPPEGDELLAASENWKKKIKIPKYIPEKRIFLLKSLRGDCRSGYRLYRDRRRVWDGCDALAKPDPGGAWRDAGFTGAAHPNPTVLPVLPLSRGQVLLFF